ncbi:MAG: hypothetical protein EAZ61_03595 [Oscillatoriales cyanobacterium]|nr:MAG: hypothetical protein EAZ61_03595 [Oscillatoriales cyanobacterium]
MLPFFSVLIALCALTGGFLGFGATRQAQEQAAINARRVVPNAGTITDSAAPGTAPAAAPANAPANSSNTVPTASPSPSQAPAPADTNPTTIVDPNPARPTPINPGDDLIPSSQGSASAAEIAAAERASAAGSGKTESSAEANQAGTVAAPGSPNAGSTAPSVPALW